MSVFNALKKDITSIIIEAKDTKGRNFLFRPYTIKEENTLLLNKQLNSKKPELVIKAIRDILNVCNINEDLNLKDIDLSSYDVQYLFLQLRNKTRGTQITLKVKCDDEKCNEECDDLETETDLNKNAVSLNVNIDDAKFFNDPNHKYNYEIKVNNLKDPIFITLEDPDERILSKISDKYANSKEDESIILYEKILDMISSCIKTVQYKDEITHSKNTKPEEFRSGLIELLNPENVLELSEFFETLPNFKTVLEWDCPHCKKHNKRVLTGLDDFLV